MENQTPTFSSTDGKRNKKSNLDYKIDYEDAIIIENADISWVDISYIY